MPNQIIRMHRHDGMRLGVCDYHSTLRPTPNIEQQIGSAYVCHKGHMERDLEQPFPVSIRQTRTRIHQLACRFLHPHPIGA
jgi:hypothetical protein